MSAVDALLRDVRNCRVCEQHLPLGPRPILKLEAHARILLIGQAPSRRVHEGGVLWDDPAGDRLREWLGLDRQAFYSGAIAQVPMGFCYPGAARGGDLPPRPECAPLWHARLLGQLPRIKLTLLIGRHAQRAYLPNLPGNRVVTVTEAVRRAADYLPSHAALPHPSGRNRPWLKRHAWFETEILPQVRHAVSAAFGD